VTSVNNNRTYHLAELDGTRIAVPVAGKGVKAFKKRHDNEPDLESGGSDDDMGGTDGELIMEI
jgi:intracellular sulfur oxidation DsrE/DsrF family protein